MKTQHQAIVEYLSQTNGWVPSYRLSKTTLCDVWVGSRGERSARDLVANECEKKLQNRVKRKLGKDLILKGITKDALGNLIEKRYAYYCAVEPLKWNTWTVEGKIIKKEPVYG